MDQGAATGAAPNADGADQMRGTMPDGSQTPGRAATTPWRYLDRSYQDGAAQRASTGAVIAGVARGAVPPTLRVYSGLEPVVILGVGQRASEIDRDVCAARGYRVLR